MSFIELNQNDTTVDIVKKCNDNFRRFNRLNRLEALDTDQRFEDISYNTLRDKPTIEEVELIGDQTFVSLGLTPLSNIEIDNLTI